MKNHQARIPSAFASLLVIGVIWIVNGQSHAEVVNPNDDFKPTTSIDPKPGLSYSPESDNSARQVHAAPREKSSAITDGSSNTDKDNRIFLGLTEQELRELALLSLSLSGIAISTSALFKANRLISSHDSIQRTLQDHIKYTQRDSKKLFDLYESIIHETDQQSQKIRETVKAVDQLKIKYATSFANLDHQVPSALSPPSSAGGQASLNQSAKIQDSYLDQNRKLIKSFDVTSQYQTLGSSSKIESTPIKTFAQKQEELTASVNRNDRLAIRNVTRTQLNITSDSESSYAIGKLVQTELEEVNGGGSYLLLELENQSLLYPTDQTLRGFGQAQPPKGVFRYQKQPIATPQVLTPALVELVGNHWRVKQLGTIAVPG